MNWKISLYWNLYTVFYFIPILPITNTNAVGLNITMGAGRRGIMAKSSSIPMMRTANATTTTTTSSTPTLPANSIICTEGIKVGVINGDEVDDENAEDFVEIIDGDAIVSVITKDPTSVVFVINRINHANLINGNFEIGIRAINVNKIHGKIEDVLLQEVEYLQHCVEHSIGVFLDYDIYKILEELINSLEYIIWSFPSTRQFLFPKVAHLLYQMPWGERIASVEILAENLNIYNDFMDSARKEQLCLMHFRSQDNIYVLLGNKLISNFKENGTIFAVPTGRTDKSFIADLPGNSYVLMESEVELKVLDENSTVRTLHESLVGKNILSSELLAISGPLLDITKWINDSVTRLCEQTNGVYYLETCPNFLTFVEDWDSNQHNYQPSEILDSLRIRKLSNSMTFEMFQKIISKMNGSDMVVDLREIASQNFITNITTYFHYNQGNESRHEMKQKFGQVFNCQYADGTNKKFPFYFEGESVMYWRLKPEAWVAAGLTASILGIIVSLAILVFIVVRITIGDVFEGNPLSSILLLCSLVVLFGTFIPFAMEYVSDHRNSRVTYEDAETMNTLCAIRIFLITLCYCMTLSLLLSRALMLASIGSEGGFLSHVNGYIQSVICLFSSLVQIGLSTQLLIVMNIADESISCDNLFYGAWFWALMMYDILLLLFLVCLTPLVFRSQRNYREGILLVIGGILLFIVWLTWIIMCFFGNEWRDAAIPLGAQASGWAILAGILIPRSFLIVRGIERSDIAQALPSLTSLAFAGNQYASEQSVYECVNPAMRHCSSREDGMCEIGGHNMQSPSEIPTLPLRGASAHGGGRGGGENGGDGVGAFSGLKRGMFSHFRSNQQQTSTTRPERRQSISSSIQSSLPPSPNNNNKITRF